MIKKFHTSISLLTRSNRYTQVDGRFFPGLKGQNILAQGKVSGGTIRNAALGNEAENVNPSARSRFS